MFKKHTLNLLPQYWSPIYSGQKTCEIRKNDRDFQKGDGIFFSILDGGLKSFPQEHEFLITHVLHFPEGLKDGYVALSIKLIKNV